jgi:glucokinase
VVSSDVTEDAPRSRPLGPSALKSRRRVVLAVDVGGTLTAAGVVTTTGEIVGEAVRPTHRGGPGTAGRTITTLLDVLIERARRDADEVVGIGVGVPAIVDAVEGRIGDEAHHIPELAGRPLAAELRDRYGLPVWLDNALTLGEWMFGAGRGSRSLVVLAPGTGFGAGLVLEGRLVRGALGFAGELGHAPVKFDGRPCWCGGRGCLAAYASGRGIAEAARERAAAEPGSALLAAAGGDPLRISAPLVFEAARAGDPTAAAVVDEACRALGAMIAIVVNGLNPEAVVVTGGVAGAFAPLEKRVLGYAAEHAFHRALVGTRVAIVPGDKRVTVRGAAALVLYERGERP